MVRSVVVFVVVIAGSWLAAVAPLSAADECQARFDGSLTRKEPGETATTLSAMVAVSLEAECATVSFDLVLVEEVSGGEQTEVRLSKQVKIRDSVPANIKMSYKLKEGRSIVGHRFEQTGCEICE